MKSSQVLIAFLALSIPFSLWYRATAADCPVPLYYKIGSIDESFSIDMSEAQAAVSEAAMVWETQAKRDLFVYDEDADFTVNFIFDERQESVDLEAVERSELDAQKQQNDQIISQIETLQSQYDDLAQSYEANIASYEARLKAHNSEVNSYNDRGGAPAEVYGRLERERVALATEADSLNETAETLNSLAQEINQLGEKGNSLVNEYNRDVNRYNSEFGYEREFTQGDYQGDRINIYSFSSEAELQRVLVHEFGHALGIGHVAEESSLMYYLMDETDSDLELSEADVAAYYDMCGADETFGQKVRHSVRSILSLF